VHKRKPLQLKSEFNKIISVLGQEKRQKIQNQRETFQI